MENSGYAPENNGLFKPLFYVYTDTKDAYDVSAYDLFIMETVY